MSQRASIINTHAASGSTGERESLSQEHQPGSQGHGQASWRKWCLIWEPKSEPAVARPWGKLQIRKVRRDVHRPRSGGEEAEGCFHNRDTKREDEAEVPGWAGKASHDDARRDCRALPRTLDSQRELYLLESTIGFAFYKMWGRNIELGF